MKLKNATRGSVTICSAMSLLQGAKRHHSSGKPASYSIFTKALQLSGVALAGFTNTGHPAAIAGPTWCTIRFSGWLNADTATTGVKVGGMLNVLRKGRIWVVSEDGNNIGDRVWVRAVAAGDPEFLGGIVNADDGTDTVDCTNQGVFLTSASAGGLAIVEVDFTNKPGV